MGARGPRTRPLPQHSHPRRIRQGDRQPAPPDDVRTDRSIAARDALEARFAGRILPLENAIVRRWGALSGRVKRETGRPSPVNDALLAATAIEADLYLVTRNSKDFSHTGAAVFDPWRDDLAQFSISQQRWVFSSAPAALRDALSVRARPQLLHRK